MDINNPYITKLNNFIFHPFEVCLYRDAYEFKWGGGGLLIITRDQILENLDVETIIPFPISAIWSANKND